MRRPKANKSLSCESYSEENIHFYSTSTWRLIEQMVEEEARNADSFSLCDLGCGDGAVLFALHSLGLLRKADTVVGVDNSPRRIERLERLKQAGLKQIIGIVSDACSVQQLASESLDLIICSQLIEHVQDDETLLKEIDRLLKKDGKAYISSVIRRWPGIWLYRNSGKWVLDPTHVHEYSSEKEFVSLLDRSGLAVIKIRVTSCRFPIWDMLVRLLIKAKLISSDRASYLMLGNSLLRRLVRKLQLPILGFYIIEALCSRCQTTSSVPHESTQI